MKNKNKYEVHYSRWYADHLSGDWEDECKKFSKKAEAVYFAKSLIDQEDIDFIKVFKKIDIE